MNHHAIILCGGQSSRMGRDKASLPFGPREVLLQRVARIVGEVVPDENIVVVAAEGQSLPALPTTIQIARDRRPERGPLEGLAAGLRAIGRNAEREKGAAAFVTSCDAPRLVPAFVRRLFGLLDADDDNVDDGAANHENANDESSTDDNADQVNEDHVNADYDIVVPRDGKFHHPLSAVYRASVLPAVESLLAADRLRMRFVFEACRTREVPVEHLRAVDSNLDSLTNCNRPEDYAAALAACGFDPPTISFPAGD